MPINPVLEKPGYLPAIITPDNTLRYRALDDAVNRAVARFADSGIARGEVVGLAEPASADLICDLLGLMRHGAVACILNPRWPEKIRTGCLDLVSGRPSHGPWPLSDNAPATIQFTSGSSGAPKAVVHLYGNHCHSALASNQNIPVVPGDRWVLSLSLHHVAGTGILFRCMLGGGAVVIPGADEPIEEAISRYAVTHVSLVSTQLYRLLRNPDSVKTLAGLKAILLGGSAIPPALIRQAFEAGLPVFTSYGMTETASQIAATRPGDGLPALLSSGRPLVPDTIKIGLDNEILVRGKSLFAGYYRNGDLDAPFDDQGWFATGDLGCFDENGYLHVIGRKDNQFISGGENIQPEEIEQALNAVPGILESVVVPEPDEEFGNVAVAFLKILSGELIDESRISTHLLETLARYKIPKKFLLWPADLDVPASKINRATLASRLAT